MEKKLDSLTEIEKKVLRKLVYNKCEYCGRPERKVGTLEIHRKMRGNVGGEYNLDNIDIICKKCHQTVHYDEPGINGK